MQELIHELAEHAKKCKSRQELESFKLKLCGKHKVKEVPTDVQILLNAKSKDYETLKKAIQVKPSRSSSGVLVVAIMTKPHKCPHGKCIYCPGGPSSEFGDVPQSYTGKEPATMRAIRNEYDPYRQVWNRLEHYCVAGHIPQKCELIIMGGTFLSMDEKYQDGFVAGALGAMNDFSKRFFTKGTLDIESFRKYYTARSEIAERIDIPLKNKQLDAEQKRNEKSSVRCVGMTVETRPDYGMAEHGNAALRLGATRIELGVQTVFEDMLAKAERGHSVADSIKSIQELKDLGFKLNFHMMPGLPGSNPKKDLDMLRMLFSDERFRPDMLKIYPCMVLKGTKLHEQFKQGKYIPINTSQAAEIISEAKRFIPEYVRIMRVQRDIPTNQTEAGVDKTNLRQYVDDLCRKKGIRCRCIRCREVGHSKIKPGRESYTTMQYDASGGTEFFISAIDEKNDLLFGFARLRFPGKNLRREITKDSAIIRELHVYGDAAKIGEKDDKKTQHKGIGKHLLEVAETIAKKAGKKKMLVISGIGVREYYRKMGYKKAGPYMTKGIY